MRVAVRDPQCKQARQNLVSGVSPPGHAFGRRPEAWDIPPRYFQGPTWPPRLRPACNGASQARRI